MGNKTHASQKNYRSSAHSRWHQLSINCLLSHHTTETSFLHHQHHCSLCAYLIRQCPGLFPTCQRYYLTILLKWFTRQGTLKILQVQMEEKLILRLISHRDFYVCKIRCLLSSNHMIAIVTIPVCEPSIFCYFLCTAINGQQI